MMMCLQRILPAAAVAGILAIATGALAQQPPPSDSNIRFSAPGLLPAKPRPGAPEVRGPLQAWPRLDPGAALCRTEEDLDRLAARHRGEPVSGPIGCQIIRAATPIAVIQRKGPGRTEVRTTNPDAGGSGWTDVWLPERAPPGSTAAAR
nr:hypothetical protein [uncultured Rhodopila sp.]